ncbi:hypothetical protein [Actinomadura geliboluensis]|uniref:hypothetical protein n=1 Tax=Actinomadura geliboluensis TaxID=882440 RepID=UPI00371733C3
MTCLRHAHALVRHAFGERIPRPHGPAFRLTALVMALGAAATALTPVPSAAAASASDDPPRARRAAPAEAPPHAILLSAPASRVPGGAPANARRAPEPVDQQAAPTEPPPPTAPQPPTEPEPLIAPPPLTAPQLPSSPSSTATAEEEPATPASAQDASQADAPKAPKQDAPQESALPDLPDSLRLEQRFAEYTLRGNGIRWRSTGGCSDRTVRTCTSFEGVRWGTVKGLIRFARSSGCKITVTGGTEHGHASGTYSHANGYKLDISPTRCVDAAIKRHPYAGRRGDGARLYRSPDGTLFAREKDHWDITFR